MPYGNSVGHFGLQPAVLRGQEPRIKELPIPETRSLKTFWCSLLLPFLQILASGYTAGLYERKYDTAPGGYQHLVEEVVKGMKVGYEMALDPEKSRMAV